MDLTGLKCKKYKPVSGNGSYSFAEKSLRPPILQRFILCNYFSSLLVCRKPPQNIAVTTMTYHMSQDSVGWAVIILLTLHLGLLMLLHSAGRSAEAGTSETAWHPPGLLSTASPH